MVPIEGLRLSVLLALVQRLDYLAKLALRLVDTPLCLVGHHRLRPFHHLQMR